MLTAANLSSLTILMKSCRQKQSWENIWRSNVVQSITNDSPSNIFKNQSQLLSYCREYHCSLFIEFSFSLRIIQSSFFTKLSIERRAHYAQVLDLKDAWSKVSCFNPLMLKASFRNCRLERWYFWQYLLNWELFYKIFEGELLVMFWSWFLLQIFCQLC